MSFLSSILGIVVLLAIAFLFSNNKKAINLRTVFGALALQVTMGALVLYVPAGREILGAAADGVSHVISYGNEGISFLFAGLVSDKMFEVFGGGGFIFAFRVLPTIIFFSALISVLYYVGVMQIIIKVLGGGLQALLGTSKAESMSAAANIFVGQTEAPLVVKPFVSKMTQSELFAVMCGGVASIAGSVMAGFASMGISLPYLIAASFMAAPGGLLFAKIIFPQTEEFNDKIENVDLEKPSNILEAAAGGASTGLSLAANVGAMLLAFVALIALINGMLGGIGSWFGYSELSLNLIFGYIFKPLAWIIGVPWSEAGVAGEMIGLKLVVNEFFAYTNFVPYLKEGAEIVLSEKTKAIITFALCGFANFTSIAILIGGIGSLAPTRRAEIAQLGFKAVLAGSLSNLMSAAIAGLFIGLGGAII